MRLIIILTLLLASGFIPSVSSNLLEGLVNAGCRFTHIQYITKRASRKGAKYGEVQTYPNYEDMDKVRTLFKRMLGQPVTFKVGEEGLPQWQNGTVAQNGRKFCPCVVHLVESNSAQSHLSLRAPELRAHPTMVWVIVSSRSATNFLPQKNGEPTPVIPVVIVVLVDFRRVGLICIPCTRSTNRLVLIGFQAHLHNRVGVLGGIRREWHMLQRNQLGSRFPIYEFEKLAEGCGLARRTMDASNCFFHFLSGSLNATFFNIGPTDIGLVGLRILDFHTTNRISLRAQNLNLHYSSHGIEDYSYKFIVVERNPGAYVAEAQAIGMLTPLPWSVWLLLLVSGCFVSAIVPINVSSFPNSGSHYVQVLRAQGSIFLGLCAISLGQGGSSMLGHVRKLWPIILWGLWSLVV